MKKVILVALVFLFIPCIAWANIVWPALYVATKVRSIPIVALSLGIEYLVIRELFKTGILRSFLYTTVSNAVSGLLGVILIPISGILWELTLGTLVSFLFHWGTFNPVAWFFVPVLAGAINACIELLTIKLIWKEKFTRHRFLIFWVANWLTVGLATLWVYISPLPN